MCRNNFNPINLTIILIVLAAGCADKNRIDTEPVIEAEQEKTEISDSGLPTIKQPGSNGGADGKLEQPIAPGGEINAGTGEGTSNKGREIADSAPGEGGSGSDLSGTTEAADYPGLDLTDQEAGPPAPSARMSEDQSEPGIDPPDKIADLIISGEEAADSPPEEANDLPPEISVETPGKAEDAQAEQAEHTAQASSSGDSDTAAPPAQIIPPAPAETGPGDGESASPATSPPLDRREIWLPRQRELDIARLPEIPALPVITTKPAGVIAPAEPETPPPAIRAGKWKQICDNNEADFLPGGYSASEIYVLNAGIMMIERRYPKTGITLKWLIGYEQIAPNKIRIGADEKNRPSRESIISFVSIAGAFAPALSLPITLDIENLGEGAILLGGKRYAITDN